jgi:hypothetical protein
MRAIYRLFALVVPMTVITTAPQPSTAAASAKDTCSLLTQTQVTDAVGTSMNAGTYMMPGLTRTCTWTLASGATPAVRFLTLDLQAADAYEAGKKLDAQANPTGVPELGDDAYYVNFSGISIASLSVKKGDVSFKLTWYGATDSQRMMSAEKSLASQVLSNL